MKSSINDLITEARRRPLGDSWTYATPAEVEQRLARLVVLACADVVYRYDELTIGQGYITAKHLKKYFGIEE